MVADTIDFQAFLLSVIYNLANNTHGRRTGFFYGYEVHEYFWKMSQRPKMAFLVEQLHFEMIDGHNYCTQIHELLEEFRREGILAWQGCLDNNRRWIEISDFHRGAGFPKTLTPGQWVEYRWASDYFQESFSVFKPPPKRE